MPPCNIFPLTTEIWGAPLNDIFARSRYEPEHELEAAIAKTGNNIKDVKQVIIGKEVITGRTTNNETFRTNALPQDVALAERLRLRALLPQGDEPFVRAGYIRVFQDVRGKYGSEGITSSLAR